MACRDAYKRSMPGRLIGVSIDAEGKTGLPPDPADPRAAHPPREGHLQHLHRAGAAGGDGQHVRGLPRPGRPDPHRPPHASPGRDPGRRAAQGRRRRSAATSSTPCTSAASMPRRSTPRPSRSGINLRQIDAHQRRHQPRRNHHARRRDRAGRAVRRRHRRHRRARCRHRRRPARRPAAHSRRSCTTRCSTPTTASTSCCATCARWPTRTWPWIAR